MFWARGQIGLGDIVFNVVGYLLLFYEKFLTKED